MNPVQIEFSQVLMKSQDIVYPFNSLLDSTQMFSSHFSFFHETNMIFQQRKNSMRGLEGRDSAEIFVNECDKEKNLHRTIHNEKDKKQNKVSFCPEVMMTEVIHHKNYTEGEKMRCWYLKSEQVQMRKEFQQAVQLMEADELEQKEHEDNEYCSRGLENFVVKRALERRKVIKAARREVFREQVIQRNFQEVGGGKEQGIIRNAEEAIAARYILFSNYCAFKAYNVGLRDEVTAFRILNFERMATMIKLQSNKTKALNEDHAMDERKRRKKLQQDRRRASFLRLFKKHSGSFRKRFSSNYHKQDIDWPVTI